MATSAFTVADLDEMSMQDLRQMMLSLGRKPKKMIKEQIIKWLRDNLPESESAEGEISPDPEIHFRRVEETFPKNTNQTIPSSVAVLPPDLQLQWLIKKEEIAVKEKEVELSIALKKEEIAATEREQQRAATKGNNSGHTS